MDIMQQALPVILGSDSVDTGVSLPIELTPALIQQIKIQQSI
ncbi:hypothetical protein [Microbulbifer okhotskensis]|nr:hypothetical protein [Microbulbifer okhotskensis]